MHQQLSRACSRTARPTRRRCPPLPAKSTVVPIPSRVVNGTLPPDPDVALYPERTLSGLDVLTNWPNPYKDVSSPTPNTLADLGLYYWLRDLRPTLENDVPASDGQLNADLDWRKDPAWWQHVAFSALAYGAGGLLDTTDVVTTTDQIAASTIPWFTATELSAATQSAQQPGADTVPNSSRHGYRRPVARHGQLTRHVRLCRDADRGGLWLRPHHLGDRQQPQGARRRDVRRQQLHVNTGPDRSNPDQRLRLCGHHREPVGRATSRRSRSIPSPARRALFGGRPAVKLSPCSPRPPAGSSPALDADNAWFASRRIVTRNVDSGAIRALPLRQRRCHQPGPPRQRRHPASRRRSPISRRLDLRCGADARRSSRAARSASSASAPASWATSATPSRSSWVRLIADFTDLNDYGYEAYKAAKASRPLRVYVGANDGMFHVFDGSDDATTGARSLCLRSERRDQQRASTRAEAKGIRALTFQDGGVAHLQASLLCEFFAQDDGRRLRQLRREHIVRAGLEVDRGRRPRQGWQHLLCRSMPPTPT